MANGEEIIKYEANLAGVLYRIKQNGTWVHYGAPMVRGGDAKTWGRFSGQFDVDKKPIYEGDILECDIILKEFGSVIKAIGVMVYSDPQCAFIVEIVNESKDYALFEVKNTKVLGNITDNPEIICPPKL